MARQMSILHRFKRLRHPAPGFVVCTQCHNRWEVRSVQALGLTVLVEVCPANWEGR